MIDERAQLAGELLRYAVDATEEEVERVLATIEAFYGCTGPGLHARLVGRLAEMTSLPRPLLALWCYHAIAMASCREGSELLVYLALRCAAARGMAPELIAELTAAAEQPRGPRPVAH